MQYTFSRIEQKYILTFEQADMLKSLVACHVPQDEYGPTTICNIYYDTPNSELITKSLEKPIYKEKLRLRSYGIPTLNSTVFVETKKKFKGIVYKRRLKMSLKNAYSFITSKANICDYTNSKQIQNELQYMFQRYDLQPAIYISYNRCAYCVKQKDKDIFRITFDDNILYRTSDLKLESGSFGEELLQKDFCIMEVKGITMPLWLTHTLNELKLYPTSFSKYGYMYMTAPKERKKERRFD